MAEGEARDTQATGKEPGFFETVRREMRLRNYSHKTIKSYLSCLRGFVGHFHPRHPREIGNQDIRNYLLHLLETRNLSASTVNQAFNALRFLYVDLYSMPFVIGNLPRPSKERKLPDILSEEEITRILKSIRNLKHLSMIMLAYASGLRVSEVVNLRVEDIDSRRGLIHIRGAKGKRDRYTVLPVSMLELLHTYWKQYKLDTKG